MNNLLPFDSNHIDSNEVFDPKQSMFIEASAGTGKTYTIELIVARLLLERTKLSQILLVTYTEKAAGELKDRIRKKIQEVLERQQLIKNVSRQLSSDELALFETALREIDSAQIFTIHSFCQKTLKTYAYDAWRPFEMELVDDSLVKNIIQRKLRDEWPNNPEFKVLLGYEETVKDENASDEGGELEKLAKDIELVLVNAIAKYYLDKNGNENPEIINLVPPFLIKDINGLKKINEFNTIYQTLSRPEYSGYRPTKTGKTIADLIDVLNDWKAPNGLFNGTSFPDPNKSNFKPNIPWPDELKTAYSDLYKFREKYKNYFQKDSYNKIVYNYLRNKFLYPELSKLYLEWRQEKLDHKLESYQDMITVVHQAIVLDDDSNLKDELRKTYQYAIIDEFQDTNRLQWDIFRTLFLGVRDHAIFVVGDPKQSIYAFQGADLTVYQEAIHTIGNGRRLDTNYRSTHEIIEACNSLFDPNQGSQFFNDESLSFEASKTPDSPKVQTTFDGKITKPVWLSEDNISDSNFAKLAAQKIIECCTRQNGKTRLQIFKDKKDSTTLRDVSFKDFAILARTKTEFVSIENELKKLGIPFVRYKDDNLFDSKECMQWIALFKAIDADDFTAYNRRILNEALLTDFFPPVNVEQKDECGSQSHAPKTVLRKLHTVNLNVYDDPQCPERHQLAKYHALARKFRWAEMIESIYRHSNIEANTASDLSKLQSLAKFQQIGNYSLEYLYAHRCTLRELIKHLDNLQKKFNESIDKDGNLVARNTDFDAVQLMTIHASKGLEFPVVISVAGFKGYNNQAKGPYSYHETVGNQKYKYLGFDEISKKNQEQEDRLEWHRLFYVAYTRASALLILPRYIKSSDLFLTGSLQAFAESQDDYFEEIHPSDERYDKLKIDVQTILASAKQNNCKTETTHDEAAQLEAVQTLQNSLGKKSLIQHSYSTLADKVQLKEVEIEPETVDSEGRSSDMASDGEEPEEKSVYRLEPNVDLHPIHIYRSEDYSASAPINAEADYPKGKQLGNAIHEVFEKIDFNKADCKSSDFIKDQEVIALINQTYAKYGLPLSRHPAWRDLTAQYVWNTLNAKLPVIARNSEHTKSFALKELSNSEHFAEVEFWLEGDLIHDNHVPKTGEYYSKGFMDLIFVREINGIKRYSILDWKSDRLESDDYSNYKAIKEKVDKEYAVQRVLYSYCLIQWLKQFYPGLSEDEIFEQHFGGIYYAFVRGTANGTANGIYAQTWDSYKTLKDNYDTLKTLMFKSAPQENEDND